MSRDYSAFFTSIKPEEDVTKKKSTQTAQSETETETEKLNIKIPPKKETRSARLQLVITPSLKERLKARADKEKLSVNDLINIILDQTV